jgi:hypothetical protein
VFNNHNQTNSLFRQEHKNSIWCWYLTMVTCFGLSLFRPSSGQRT